jgi:methionyl-tRNA formyltransferase
MTHSLRVVFAGTPEFAALALAAIHSAGFPVSLVLTQPDRPAGRGMKLSPSAVKRHALEHGLPVEQPTSLRRNGKYPEEATAAIERLKALQPDVMVVAAYGLILPQEVLDIPRYGCINIHASLLPRWRGAAPIHRAIEAGDAESGVTLMQMDAGLDTGAMISVAHVPIDARTSTAILHDALAETGARLIVEALVRLEADQRPLPAQVQPADGVTYAEKIAKSEAQLDWRQPADVIARKIRAFDPFPGASGQLDGVSIKLWAADVCESASSAPSVVASHPGTIVSAGPDGLIVACGQGAIRVTECQKPGGKRLPVREFLVGFPIQSGQCFTRADTQSD